MPVEYLIFTRMSHVSVGLTKKKKKRFIWGSDQFEGTQFIFFPYSICHSMIEW